MVWGNFLGVRRDCFRQELVELIEVRAKVDVGIAHLKSNKDHYDAIVLSNVLGSQNVS